MEYIIDSDILINMYRKYPRDKNNYDRIWIHLESLIESGEVLICKEVYLEIQRGGDDLYRWLNNFSDKIIDSDRDIQTELGRIMNTYAFVFTEQPSKHGADPWVIALAIVREGIVVTNEGGGALNRHILGNLERMKEQPTATKMIDICHNEGVEWRDLVGFLIETGTFRTR